MIAIPPGVRIYLAMGPTDMRKGFDGLSMLAQELLKQEPFSGHLFVFRGKRGDLVKVLYWDGQGFCLFAKRLEKAASCGRSPRKARSPSPPRSCRCCWKASTGELLNARGSRRSRDSGEAEYGGPCAALPTCPTMSMS
jgi:hypothetical protein